MKIVVTGATGFVGSELVPVLGEAGAELLLVGRDPARIRARFPSLDACSYDELGERGRGCDAIVHMATINTDSTTTLEAARQVNVELALRVAAIAREAGIPRIVNISSVHALQPENNSIYAATKREAALRMRDVEGVDVSNVYLAAVYGRRWSGKLGVLNRLPPALGRALFTVLAALKPTVHIDKLARYVLGWAGAAPGTGDTEVVLTDGQSRNLVYRGVKRLIDLCFALVVVFAFWWLLLIVWIAIRLQSAGPGVFVQPRVGRGERIFNCFKFRTMKVGTAQAASNLISASSVTGLGRFLRRTKLDELPQVWNILRNEIGLVGPRPCLPVQKELVEARRRRGVYALMPGISGLAQIRGVDMSDPERLAVLDQRYLALQCLALDLRIMIATAMGSGQGDRVLATDAGPTLKKPG